MTREIELLQKKKQLDEKHSDLLDKCLDAILEGGNSTPVFEEMKRIEKEIKLIKQELEILGGEFRMNVIDVEFKKKNVCYTCEGYGAVWGDDQLCPHCNGHGTIEDHLPTYDPNQPIQINRMRKFLHEKYEEKLRLQNELAELSTLIKDIEFLLYEAKSDEEKEKLMAEEEEIKSFLDL